MLLNDLHLFFFAMSVKLNFANRSFPIRILVQFLTVRVLQSIADKDPDLTSKCKTPIISLF